MANKNDWKDREVGAFWKRETENGEKTYLTGYVTIGGKKINLVVYKNKFKEENEKAPDYRVYLDSRQPDDKPADNKAKPEAKKESKPKEKAEKVEKPADDEPPL